MSARRGQALVVWSLTLLLLVLMVLVTLELSMRIRDRTEAQMVADTAAYSQAVTTARTFNMTAVVNRAEIAHFVALLGTESLISWSGMVRGSTDALAAAFDACGARAQATRLRTSAVQPNALWELYDDGAGAEARAQQGAAYGLRGATQSFYQDELMGRQLKDQQLTSRLAQLANRELTAPPTGDAKSMAEVAPDCASGPVCLSSDTKPFMSAVMGSRGWVFTTDRSAPFNTWKGASPLQVLGVGGSGFGDDPWFGAATGVPAERSQFAAWMTPMAAWAHDHGGTATVRIGACVQSVTVSSAFVMSSADEVLTDKHSYNLSDEGQPEYVRHTLLPCPPTISGCPKVIEGPLTFNRAQLTSAANDFGQPKLYSIIERDYRTRPSNPWDLAFRFQFSRSGSGSTFDNGGSGSSFTSPAGFDLAKQVAVGAGLVYYHRPSVPGGGGYLEPPNLFNPFWRATLAEPDRDLGNRLNAAGYPVEGAVYDLFMARGYRGMP